MIRETSQLLSELGSDLEPTRAIRELRVGERQLVEIAKALSLEAQVLIMDEPTSALSVSEVEKLFTVMRGLRARGVAIIYISHRLEEVFAVADRITVLRDGRHILTAPAQSLNRSELIRLMVGRSVETRFAEKQPPSAPQEALLEVRDLGLDRPGFVPLQGISLRVGKGEIVSVAGLMGSGQTELLETLFGDAVLRENGRATTGEISFTPAVARQNQLRRLADQASAYQTAEICVNGTFAGIWQQPLGNTTRRWLEDTFELPPTLTGKRKLTIRLVPPSRKQPGLARSALRSVVAHFALSVL